MVWEGEPSASNLIDASRDPSLVYSTSSVWVTGGLGWMRPQVIKSRFQVVALWAQLGLALAPTGLVAFW